MTQREETNSAIGSWSGFIYQGLCGLLVALRMLKENPEDCKNYALQLDGFEDFSILDENGKIYSLHQCKCVKGKTNYKDEFDKITEKIKANKDKLKDPEHPKYFFHCNCKVDIDGKYNVIAYPFETDKTYCEPGNIQKLLSQEVLQLKTGESNTEAVRAALEAMVNTEVLDTQQKFFDAKPGEQLWKISRQQKISFADFQNKLAMFIPCYAPGDFILQMKSAFIMQMDERADEEGNDGHRKKVDIFINRLTNLSTEELRNFIQRINPKEKTEDTHDSWRVITSKERINYLYNLITEFPLEMNGLHWKTSNTTQTPSTLGNDEPVSRISKHIYENQANLDIPWLYDWIVGHVEEHVDNIVESARVITDISDVEMKEKSIFQAKKVGILTTNDKRDGKND